MAEKAFIVNSKFNIYSSFNISADDVNTLSILYAPLIGSDAFLLYMAFSSFLRRNDLAFDYLSHKEFIDIYSFKDNSFLKARYKLEAIGLLVSYVSNDSNYIYILCPPFTPKNYFVDSPLGLYLKSKLNERTFNYIYDLFKVSKIDKSNLKNITKAFDEVFDSEVYSSITIDKFDYILGRNYNDRFILKNNEFDIEKFVKNIDIKFLELGLTEEFKKQISTLSYVYGLSVDEMVNLYNDSIGRNCYFDYKLLKKKASIYFQYRRNIDSPKLHIKDSNDKDGTDLVEYLDNVTPDELISSIREDYPYEYLATVNEIYSTIDLPRGVLNCMILKILREKNGELPKIKYFQRVAESWVKDNVFNTLDAIKYVTTLKEKNNTKSSLSNNPIDLPNGGFDEL